MTAPTIHDLEGRLAAAAPEFMAWMREKRVWEWEREDDEETAFLLLDHLRLWLLEHRRERQALPRVWEGVEALAATEDPVLLNALMTALLEGHWPKAQQRLMGPRTRALWDQMRP